MQNFNAIHCPELSIPIVYLSDSPALEVSLDIFKPTAVLSGLNNSTEFYADPMGKRQYDMARQQVRLGSKYVYMKVLTIDELKEIGGYTGVFVAKRQDQNGTVIIEEQISINLEENLFDKQIGGMKLSQMIADTYTYMLLKSGKVPYTCLGAIPQKAIFRTNDGKCLPASGVYTVLTKDSNDNLSIYKEIVKIPLQTTDNQGYDLTTTGNGKWNVTEDDKPASYCVLALPKGEYKVFAEYIYNGKKQVTDYITLIF
jgi:hypothetical protein